MPAGCGGRAHTRTHTQSHVWMPAGRHGGTLGQGCSPSTSTLTTPRQAWSSPTHCLLGAARRPFPCPHQCPLSLLVQEAPRTRGWAKATQRGCGGPGTWTRSPTTLFHVRPPATRPPSLVSRITSEQLRASTGRAPCRKPPPPHREPSQGLQTGVPGTGGVQLLGWGCDCPLPKCRPARGLGTRPTSRLCPPGCGCGCGCGWGGPPGAKAASLPSYLSTHRPPPAPDFIFS